MQNIFFFFLLFYNRYKQGNFENNTKPCIILGYSSNSPGYHVGDINSKTIIIIQDDIFQIKVH